MTLVPSALYAEFALDQIIDKNPVVRQSALRQLAAMPPAERERYLPELVVLVRAADDIRPVVLGLVKIGPPAVPTLRILLADSSMGMRGCAAEALAMIRPVARQDIERLRSMLKDNDEWVRQRVAESLLSAGVRDALAESIVQKERLFHGRGSQAPGGISDWIASLAPSDPTSAGNALFSLVKLGEPAVPSLVQALRNPDANIRAGAAEALEEMRLYRSEIEAAFIRAISDPSQRVRDAARYALGFTVTEAAKDALLRDEIAETGRQKDAAQRDRANRTRPHTVAEILAPIPPDPDHTYALEVANQFETKAPDGTLTLTVLHSGQDRPDLLRVWSKRNGGYFLAWEDNADNPNGGTPHLLADQFHFSGLAYIHTMRFWEGTGSQHEDKYFRLEKGSLAPLKTPQGLPVELAAKEGVWKGFALRLEDDHLSYQFWIWKEGDGNCCPTAGTVSGTYTIVGDELRYATWKRSAVEAQ